MDLCIHFSILGPCTTFQHLTFNQLSDGAVKVKGKEGSHDHALSQLLFIHPVVAGQILNQVLLKPCFVQVLQVPPGIYQKVIQVPGTRPLFWIVCCRVEGQRKVKFCGILCFLWLKSCTFVHNKIASSMLPPRRFPPKKFINDLPWGKFGYFLEPNIMLVFGRMLILSAFNGKWGLRFSV